MKRKHPCSHCHKVPPTSGGYCRSCKNEMQKKYRKIHPEWKKISYESIRIGNKTIKKHRWIMEKHLNRFLRKNEYVHHINGDPLDNRLENLRIVSASEHYRLHHLKDSGSQNNPSS